MARSTSATTSLQPGTPTSAPPTPVLEMSRHATRRVVRAMARFVVRNGGFATAFVERTGLRGARVVLIAVNGVWGDYVLPSVAAAREVCGFAGIEVAPAWSLELASRMDRGASCTVPHAWLPTQPTTPASNTPATSPSSQ